MLYCSNSAWNLLQYPKNQTRSYQTLDVLGWDNHHLRPAEFCLGRDFTTGRIRSRHLAKRLGSRGHHGKVIRRKKKNNSFSTFIIILRTFTIHLSWSCTSIIKDVEHMIKICSKTSFTSLPQKKMYKNVSFKSFETCHVCWWPGDELVPPRPGWPQRNKIHPAPWPRINSPTSVLDENFSFRSNLQDLKYMLYI